MTISIFQYREYKSYMVDMLKNRGNRGIGEKSRLAKAVRCHTTYLSQVLHANVHLSLEQADLVNQHFGHGKDESLFFLLLVQHARAGTASLKAILEEQIESLVRKQLVLRNRFKGTKTLSKEDQARFYSAWYYGAIHVVVAIPGCETKEGISRYLGLPMNLVSDVADFLVSLGLLRERDGRFERGIESVHLWNDSPLISKHHTNWRLQAIQSLERHRTQDVHYSSVITVSRADSEKMKSILIKAIEDIRALIGPSKDEAAFCYGIDFFELARTNAVLK